VTGEHAILKPMAVPAEGLSRVNTGSAEPLWIASVEYGQERG
jgi:hypothetical protein